MDDKQSVEYIRMQLWKEIAVVVARAENTRDREAPARWADQVLKDFDKTFSQ